MSNSVSTAEGDLPLSSIEIIDARLEVTTVAPFDSGGFGELPLIVLEGLPEPRYLIQNKLELFVCTDSYIRIYVCFLQS